MELSREIIDGVTIFTFGSRLTDANIAHIAEAVDAQIHLGAVRLVFNLSQVEFIHPAAFEYLMFTHERLPTLAGELVLSEPSSYVRKLLHDALQVQFVCSASDAGAVEHLGDPHRHRRD